MTSPKRSDAYAAQVDDGGVEEAGFSLDLVLQLVQLREQRGLSQGDLAARIGVPPDAIKKRSTRPAVWPDASLGCPKPDTMYAQVETPGFEIELEANGKTYQYHSDLQHVVPCD